MIWDERKRSANLGKHGLDFADAPHLGWENATIVEAKPARDGRPRSKAIGFLAERAVVIVYSLLGREAMSIISMRPASASERKRHAQD